MLLLGKSKTCLVVSLFFFFVLIRWQALWVERTYYALCSFSSLFSRTAKLLTKVWNPTQAFCFSSITQQNSVYIYICLSDS